MLDEGDGLDLLAYVADLLRPPVLVDADGNRLELPQGRAGAAAPMPVGARTADEVMTHLEQRWCSEPVPARAGLTPEQAAADLTRRDDVVRLIASFPVPDPGTGVLGLRPQQLRDRLGL